MNEPDPFAPVTGTDRASQAVASSELRDVSARLGQLQSQLQALEQRFEELGAPYTSGRGVR